MSPRNQVVSTVVHTHKLFGRFSLLPVLPAPKLIVPSMFSAVAWTAAFLASV